MITSLKLKNVPKANVKQQCYLGNTLFMIAGVIGIAIKNGYDYGFLSWSNQEYFVNPLPVIDEKTFNGLNPVLMPANFKGLDAGFMGFDLPDNSALVGQFGTEKYWKHCEPVMRKYLTMKDIYEPYKDCIIISYREYQPGDYKIFARMDYNYFQRALSLLPKKRVVVVTNDVAAAKKTIREDFEYVTVSPIIDFYLLTKAEYLIMSNSTFSWWGAWISQAKTIAPKKWMVGEWEQCPSGDFYCEGWTII